MDPVFQFWMIVGVTHGAGHWKEYSAMHGTGYAPGHGAGHKTGHRARHWAGHDTEHVAGTVQRLHRFLNTLNDNSAWDSDGYGALVGAEDCGWG